LIPDRHSSGRWPKAVLFDLDGTLIDSAPDITAAVNELLENYDLPSLSLAQVKTMIGEGVRKLVERAFAASDAKLSEANLEEAFQAMGTIYYRHLTQFTRLMPGAAETLVRLHSSGIRLGVVTNKPQVAARTILLHFRLAERLGTIIGGDAVMHGKPAPDALLLALQQLDVLPEEALMVGDSATDVAAARAAEMPVAVVRGGYSRVPLEELEADFICRDLPALLAAIESAATTA